jgi:hypothetical protein
MMLIIPRVRQIVSDQVVLAVLCMGIVLRAGEAWSAAPELASHAAVYELSLTRAAQMEGVRSASGTMTYTLIDRCDGYTVESDIEANLGFSNGLTNQLVKRYAGWESKDGRRTTFRMQIYENGELEASYAGSVNLAADGSGRAVYDGPEPTAIDLPPGTMLSVAQMRDLLQAAQSQVQLISQSVMDGAFEDGPYRVTGFIAPQRITAKAGRDPGMSVTVAKDAALLKPTYWPVSLAYFPLGKNAELPEYETGLDLMPNGVVRAMTQDYGGYTLALDLTRLMARDGGCEAR